MREYAVLNDQNKHARRVVFSPDGSLLASVTVNSVLLWDTVTWEERAYLDHEKVGEVVFSPDGKLIASGSTDGVVKLWDVANRQQLALLRPHTYVVASLSFSPDGLLLASSSWDNTIQVWDVAARRGLLKLAKRSYCIRFSPDGTLLAFDISEPGDRSIKLWGIA
jgi:WD40 repeat protein